MRNVGQIKGIRQVRAGRPGPGTTITGNWKKPEPRIPDHSLTRQNTCIYTLLMDGDSAMLETTQCLCLAVRRAARTITRAFDRELRAHGLRATQFTMLAALDIKGPQTIGELADLLGAERTTLTRNLGLVEERALVRIRAGEDARARIASITPKGRRTLQRALPAWRKVQGDLVESIGAQAAIGLRRLAGGPCVIGLPATGTARKNNKEPRT